MNINFLIKETIYRFHLQKYQDRHKIRELLVGANTDGVQIKKVRS